MPIKPLPYIDKQGHQYSSEVKAKIDAAIRAKAAEMSEDKKLYDKPELKRLEADEVSDEVKAEFDVASAAMDAIPGFAQGGYEPKYLRVRDPEPEPLIAGKFAPRFDVRIFSTVIRELMVYRLNQMGLVNTQEHFWQAQQDVMLIKAELETAYRSGIQKAQMQKRQEFTDLWMFGLLAYQRLTEDGLRLKDFLETPKARMERQAAELGKALMKKAETDGESVCLFTKKSREKE